VFRAISNTSDFDLELRAAPHPAAATFSPQAARRALSSTFSPVAGVAENCAAVAVGGLLPACGEKVPAGG
jgi:hypothetical protein